METNSRLELAHRIIEQTGCSLFLTGKAGTGKTTFLRKLRTSSKKRMIVAAPTGIAAINAGGVTLHSFFQLDFGLFIPDADNKQHRSSRSMKFSKEKIRMIRGLDLLVIDEVSMVRADVLDAVDAVLRRFRDRTLPFGGVQLLLIGDLQQLPPVVLESERPTLAQYYQSPYFFHSHALQQLNYLTVELSHVYRQSDEKFISLLNSVRDHNLNGDTLQKLNTRYIPDFEPDDSQRYIRLTTHNRLASEINNRRLAEIDAPAFTFHAYVEGNFPETSFPVDGELTLKEGAQVMFVKNDTGYERRFFNGMIGEVTSISEKGVVVTPQDGGYPIEVQPMEWENVAYEINGETNTIEQKREGLFRQLPLRLAWSITIHKSQGLTFSHAIIDASLAFAHGQTYVALSRCRSLEGLVLEKPLSPNAIISDYRVTTFLQENSAQIPSDTQVSHLEHDYQLQLVESMFNFRMLFSALEGVRRIMQENFNSIYPQKVAELEQISIKNNKEILEVGARFISQIRSLDSQDLQLEDNAPLMRRIKDASVYFKEKIGALIDHVDSLPSSHDNKKVAQKVSERVELFMELANTALTLLNTFAEEDFSYQRYLDIKASAALKAASKKKSNKAGAPAKSEYSEDNVHPDLFDKLILWRRSEAQKRDVPAFTIMSTKALLSVANYLPTTFNELSLMPGIGRATMKAFGDDLIDMVEEYMDSAENLVMIPIPQKSAKSKKHHHQEKS